MSIQSAIAPAEPVIGRPEDETAALKTIVFERNPASAKRQATIGLSLAFGIFLAWLAAHIGAIFFFPLQTAWPLAPLVVALQCWLYVGLFIVAHDCMHGSLVPSQRYRWVNRAVGASALFIYAGFSFPSLNTKHHDHHRHAGTEGDPDFDEREPHGFFRWYGKFFGEYLTWRQPLVIGCAITFYAVVLGAPLLNLVVFWAVPALLSSMQLFFFGTYLPHRPDRAGFADRHNARTNDFSWLVSLLTCFHFGYHHEHHLSPGTPWWGLPSARKAHRSKLCQVSRPQR